MKHLSLTMPALLLAASVLASAPAQAGRDPFARPALPHSALTAAPTAAQAEAAAAAEPAARPQLRAIMVAPGQALANIGGRILAVGERYGDYRVLSIRERSVTLVTRSGARTELALDQVSTQ